MRAPLVLYHTSPYQPICKSGLQPTLNILKWVYNHIIQYYITHTRTYVCIRTCTYIHTLTYVCTCIHTYIHIRTNMHTYIHQYINTYIHIRACINTYIHIHVCFKFQRTWVRYSVLRSPPPRSPPVEIRRLRDLCKCCSSDTTTDKSNRLSSSFVSVGKS